MGNKEAISFLLLKYFVYFQTLQKDNIDRSCSRFLLANNNNRMFEHNKRFGSET